MDDYGHCIAWMNCDQTQTEAQQSTQMPCVPLSPLTLDGLSINTDPSSQLVHCSSFSLPSGGSISDLSSLASDTPFPFWSPDSTTFYEAEKDGLNAASNGLAFGMLLPQDQANTNHRMIPLELPTNATRVARRRAQNRESQRAYRQRKDTALAEATSRVQELEAQLQDQSFSQEPNVAALQDRILFLEKQNRALKSLNADLVASQGDNAKLTALKDRILSLGEENCALQRQVSRYRREDKVGSGPSKL